MIKPLRIMLASAFVAMLPVVAHAQSVTTVIDQSFAAATAGTEESPEAFASYGTGSFSSLFGYRWTQSGVMSAGGSILIPDGGYIYQSAYASSSNGPVKVTVECKMRDDYGGAIVLKFGSTTNPSTSTTHTIYDNEWHSVEFVTAVSGYSNYVRVEPFLSASGILVKSIKVEQSTSFLAAPVALQPNQADGSSFTARWNAVTGATAYFLDVYSYDGDNKVFAIENRNVGNVTSYAVSDLDPAVTYYYVVRVSNNEATSSDSNEIEVVKIVTSLDTPVTVTATDITESGFTANWQPVAEAHGYIVSLYRHETLQTETNVNVYSEDFDEINEGTIESTKWVSDINRFLTVEGWDTEDVDVAAGHIVLNPFGGTASAKSPAIDLSENGGVFTVTFNINYGSFGSYYTGGSMVVNLLDALENVVETQTIVTDSNEFKDYTVSFTKGAQGSRIEMQYVDSEDSYASSYRIFINAMTVSQVLPAGSVVNTKVRNAETDGISYPFHVALSQNVSYSYTVQAFVRTVVAGSIDVLFSEVSSSQKVAFSAGVDSVIVGENAVKIVKEAAGVIAVELPEDALVEVYDLAGRKLFSGICPQGHTSVAIDASGVVIVRAAAAVAKIAL